MVKVTVMWLIFLSGCTTSKPYATGPIKTFDPDTARIPLPEKRSEYLYWDRIDKTVFHQISKPLDLNRTVRLLGKAGGITGEKEADNINHLDEVPESSWFSRRHYYNPMTKQALAQGPNTVAPDTSGKWTIFGAKQEGSSPGFFIRDRQGHRFLIKFDSYQYPELTTAAETISSKFFYAAGYTVPEAMIVYFDPERLTIEEGVTITENGRERRMTRADYRDIVSDLPQKDGKIRALASKYVEGTLLGPWAFEGTRDDDPNDRVKHQHRRELRGMRVISSWLNDTDRRSGNTIAAYTKEGYIRHYVQDFGSTLGANGSGIHMPIHGQAYIIDPRYMWLSALGLGAYILPWENLDPTITYPAVGYFRVDVFEPGRWVPSYPNPAFENMTLRDAFWGAKIVMSFSDEDIRAIVETGKISDPEAEERLIEILAGRRDKIGRYWFGRINPLDKFSVHHPQPDTLTLSFSDLSVSGGLASPEEHRYLYGLDVDGKLQFRNRITQDPEISLAVNRLQMDETNTHILKLEIYTLRESEDGEGKNVEVYIEYGSTAGPRIVGVRRES